FRHYGDGGLAGGGNSIRRNAGRKRGIGRGTEHAFGRAFSFAFLGATSQRRRHQRLVHLGRIADRARNQAALALPVVIGRVLDPDVEFVLAVASKRVADHAAPFVVPLAPRNGDTRAGSAGGPPISKRRPWLSDGTRLRAAATAARS